MVLFGKILTLGSRYGTIVFIAVLGLVLLFEGGNSFDLISPPALLTIPFVALGALEKSCHKRGLHVSIILKLNYKYLI